MGTEAGGVVSRHVSVYRRMLLVYPAAFRHAYAEEMVRLFEDLLAEARRPGERPGVLRLWMSSVIDLLTSATHQRMEDAMNNHPALTRLLLVAVPTATLTGLFVVGPALGLAASALGIVLLALRWRTLATALRGPGRSQWWIGPLVGLALIGAAVGITALPGPGDLRWGLASLLFVIGALIALGSVLRSLVAIVSRPPAPPFTS